MAKANPPSTGAAVAGRYKWKRAGKRVSKSFIGRVSRTKRSEAKACDINLIMAKYQKTGQLPAMIQRQASYGDFSEAKDYQDALNTVLMAQEQFAGLPAKARDRFKNDPEEFLRFCSDPKNRDEMGKMGLLRAEAVKPPENRDAAPGAASNKGDAGGGAPPTGAKA